MAVVGFIPKVMGISTTMAVTPLRPGMAPKIIPMMVPKVRRKIPGHPNISLIVDMRQAMSNTVLS